MHGTHRGVSDEHLQVYLDEFVFRHNRRGTPMAASRPSSASAPNTSPAPTNSHPTGHLTPLGANRIRINHYVAGGRDTTLPIPVITGRVPLPAT